MNMRDLAALVIAVGLVLWGIIAFVALAYHDKQLSEIGGDALIAIGGGLVAALAAYLGQREGH